MRCLSQQMPHGMRERRTSNFSVLTQWIFSKATRFSTVHSSGAPKHLAEILPVLAKKVKRTIVINAVMVSTLEHAVTTLKGLGIFTEVVQVQISRSHNIAGSIMFRPVDPVYVIVARGSACS